MRNPLQDPKRRLLLLGQGLSLVWRAARTWTIVWGGLLLLQGILPALLIWLTRHVLNRLSVPPSQTVAALTAAGPALAGMALCWLLSQALASAATWVRTAQAELVQDHIHALIHRQALRLDLAFFETPGSYDLLHRARGDAAAQPLILLESLGTLIQNSLTILVLAFFLAGYSPWLPLLLTLSALPGIWTLGRHVLLEHRWRNANTSKVRRVHYFDWMLTERASAAEMRLFDLGEHHRASFRELRAGLRRGRLELASAAVRAELLSALLTWAGGVAGMGWMLLRTARGEVRLGDLVLCYQAFQQGQKLLHSLLEKSARIYQGTLFLENLFSFLALSTETSAPAQRFPISLPLTEGLRFEGVTFNYPGSSRPALSKFFLSVPAGRVTAIVGLNGAGKSTLIKLLCRFYDPQEGKVLLDGTDLRELDPDELRRHITVLFQEPVRYHTTAAENIALGDIASRPDEVRVRAAARAAGAEAPIERLGDGYQTVLGKWFGGAELSVGEWQRIALARAFLRNAPLIVLDEPTSAMDSWAEADWLAKFRELTRGHTALMITHRFTTAMYADIIHVMQQGRIIESGTHDELIAAGGYYASSWETQIGEAVRA